MSATLTIELSDELLELLRCQSLRDGKTPEAIAASYLTNLLLPPPNGATSPDQILRWIGAFDSGIPDVAERTDDYLGQAFKEELQGGQG